MKTNEREIVIYWKPGENKDKNTYTLARQISNHIEEIDIIKNPPTQTQLKELVDLLDVNIESLIETESEIYKKQFDGMQLEEPDWLIALVRNPSMIKTPIVIKGKKALIIETPSNVLALDPKGGVNDIPK